MDMSLPGTDSRDSEGYLIDPESWDRNIAAQLAAEERLDLDESTWSIVDFMRAYWLEHRVAPDVRHVVDFLVDSQNLDRKAAKARIFELFPYGYVKQACKVAGMMRPRAWSTG